MRHDSTNLDDAQEDVLQRRQRDAVRERAMRRERSRRVERLGGEKTRRRIVVARDRCATVTLRRPEARDPRAPPRRVRVGSRASTRVASYPTVARPLPDRYLEERRDALHARRIVVAGAGAGAAIGAAGRAAAAAVAAAVVVVRRQHDAELARAVALHRETVV